MNLLSFIRCQKSKIKSILFGFVLLVLLSFSLSAHARTTLKVGYYEAYYFQEGSSESQTKSGYGYEYLQEISNYTGWSYEYVYGDWTSLYDQFIKGEIDLLGGISKTLEREEKMSFPTSVMGSESYYIYKLKSNTTVALGDYDSYSGVTIGTVKNNIATDDLLLWIDTNHVDLQIKYYDDFQVLENAFYNGEVELFASANNSMEITKDIVMLDYLGESEYYLCSSKLHPEYAKQIDDAYSQIKATNPNFLTDLQMKYYSSAIESIELEEEEIEFLKNLTEIKIGYLDEYLPFSDSNDGKVSGIVQDLVPEIFNRLLVDHEIKYSYYCYSSAKAMIEALHTGGIDLCFPLGGGYYFAEQNDICLTNTILSVNMNIVFNGNYDETTAKTIAVNKNNLLQYYYIINYFPDAITVECDSIQDCLDAVISGKAKSTIINGLRTSALLNNSTYSKLNCSQLPDLDQRSMAVAKDNSILFQLLNHGIFLLDDDFAINASYKYIDDLSSSNYTGMDFFRDNIVWIVIIVFSIVLTILLIILLFLRKTRKEEKKAYQALMMNEAMIKDYTNVLLIDCTDSTIRAYKMNGETLHLGDKNARVYQYFPFCEQYINSYVCNEDKRMLHEAMKLEIVLKNTRDGMDYVKTYQIEERGVRHYYQFKYTRLQDTDNIIVGFQNVDSLVVAERNNQKALEQALEASNAANKAKTLFLNNMSHDIRTPMNAIIGYTNLAQTHPEDKEKVVDYLDKISTSSTHLLSLINDVLDMSRIESGKVHLEEDAVHLPTLVEELKIIQQAVLTQKNITFDINLDLDHPTVVADKLRLNQILLNIFGNAVKFTNEGGNISMSIAEYPLEVSDMSRYEFRIKDNGIGMDKSFLVHIFEPFTRERTSTVSGIQGTGLGMAITKNLVDMMNGTIHVESEAGVGTEFIVTIPFKISMIARKRKEDEQSEGYAFIGKKVLLVDDNELNREIATEILKEYGFIIETADDGSVAVDKIKKSEPNEFDFILMDIQMPKMNGYEATKAIRKLGGPQSTIPIIAMTANAFQEDKQLAFQAGMNGHVAKPIDIPVLLEAINTIFK